MIHCGKHTYGIENIKVMGDISDIYLGNFCSIAGNVTIFTGANHNIDWITTYPFGHINKDVFNMFNGQGHPQSRGDVIIDNDVWIGWGVTIMSGVHIGNGSVVGANSHVVSDVKPYSVVGGNPAQRYYFRFEEEIIQKLLELRWWDWDDEKINEMTPILCSGDYEKILSL
jgi:acetyltransferase-like isoleucine patch superfamily enzyme